MAVEIPGEKYEGTLIKRVNRFEAIIDINGVDELCHVPNTGRMKELALPGARVIVSKATNKNRKTAYTLISIYKGENLICINSIIANKMFEDALINNKFDWISGTPHREVCFQNSRFDFFVESTNKDEPNTYVEVKSCTYEKDGVMRFPDAPTLRGARHVEELIDARHQGFRSAIVIIGLMDNVHTFVPFYEIDEKFSAQLIEARNEGVIVKAYKSKVTSDKIYVSDEIQIKYNI